MKSHRLAVWLAAATILGSWLLYVNMPWRPTAAYLAYFPGGLVAMAYGRNDSLLIMLLAIVVHVLGWVGLWYAVIILRRKASRDCLRALSGCAVLAVWGWLWLDWYQHAEDWTSRGLNPDRPGFTPTVVVLAGEVSSPRGTFDFEMRMRGQNYHYCRRWKGKEWRDVGPSWRLELEMADFSGHYGQTRYGYSTKGGGGSGGRTDSLVPGRRLWKGNQFVGASEKEAAATRYNLYNNGGQMLIVGEKPDESEFRGSREVEVYSDFKRVGDFLVPLRIVYDQPSLGRGREVFRVKRVEFHAGPDEEWFHQVKRKYFDHDQALRVTDIGEPGKFVWGKKPL